MNRRAIAAIIAGISIYANAERWDVRDYVTLPDPTTQVSNTCWAHASVHGVMANWGYLSYKADAGYTEYPTDSVLSAEHLIAHRGYNNDVANGGSVDYAVAYYGSGQGPKVVNAAEDTVDAKYMVGSVNKIPYSNSTEANLQTSITLIKTALKTYGAVSIVLNTTELQSPYYDATNHSAYMSSTNASGLSANHAGTIVGYDDDYNSFDNLADKPTAAGAWIVENTYGTSRDDGGFYYLSYYTGTMKEPVSYMNRISRETADTIMTKDRLGACGQSKLSNDTVALYAYYSNPRGVTVKAIGVYTTQVKTKIRTVLLKGSNPGNSTALTKKDTVLALPGYHLVAVPETEVQAGDSIGLAIQYLTVDGSNITLALEYTNSTGTAVATNAGDQYMYYNSKWYKGTSAFPKGNFIMKMYCKNKTAETIVNEASEQKTPALKAWSAEGNSIAIKTEKKTEVNVYDMAGRLVERLDVDGETSVDVAAGGLYVVAADGETVKVQK